MDQDVSVQVTVALPVAVRRACEQRAAAERRSLSNLLRGIIEDDVVGRGGGPVTSSAAGGR